jgi:hypothetical protein
MPLVVVVSCQWLSAMVPRLGKGNEMKNMTTNANGWGASSMAPGQDRLISKREAAGILGVSIRTVERAVSHGSISIRKIRGCVRLLLSEVLIFGGIQ